MAETDVPNGETWINHQRVIMAINIKSMNDFEPVDGATPVFYGSNTPFTITGPSDPSQRLSITGTDVKPYMAGGNINTITPVLLVTRVRDIENSDIGDLDKKYIVCSNVEINANAITATITDKVYSEWSSLPVLTKYYMDKYNDIFARRKKGTDLRKQIIANAINSTKKYFGKDAAANRAKDLAAKKAIEEAAMLAKEKIDNETVQNARINERKLAKQEQLNDCTKLPFGSEERKKCLTDEIRKQTAINKKRIAEENSLAAQAVRDARALRDAALKRRPGWKGGALTDNTVDLNDIISNEKLNFKQYVYFLLMQPFYFKLNALTPISLNNIKNYNLSGGSTGTFDSHILQPFAKFSYVKYVNTVTTSDALINHLSELIAHQTQEPIKKFADQIVKDTTNYKQLNSNGSDVYYIHIFRFIELIEKTLKKYPSTQTNLPEQIKMFIKYAFENIHAHMMNVKPLFDLLISVDDIYISDKLQSSTKSEKPLHIYIDDYVSSQNRTDVITYLKINNTEPGEVSDNQSWNQRYDIHLKQAYLAGSSNSKFNAMILGYKAVTIPFYKQVTDESGEKRIVAANTPELDDIVKYKSPKIIYDEIEKVNAYDNYYLFGNYENIFPLYNIENGAKETNINNAKRMKAIIEQICTHKKPVFLLGYGASGSGKTSSLIYFNNGKDDNEKNGIVIHLCKEIIEKLNASPEPVDPAESVKSINVVVKEFYTTNKQQTMVSGPYVFKPDLTYEGDIVNSAHTYHVNMNKHVDKFENMGQVLKQLVDVDRYVKATTNNPQSSRSHVLVFIQFCSDDAGTIPIRNLIIGDFAGKENAFECGDTDTVVAFLNKKVENKEIVEILNSKLPPSAVKPETYTFYGAQLMQSGGDGYANDPIDKLVTEVDNKMLTQDELNNREILQTSSGMLFDFEKPSNSINKADINNPAKYDSFKMTADQYAPIVIKYYFKDEPVPTDLQPISVKPLNNSKIYHKLLNDKDKFDNVDKGIDIFNIYTKTAVSDDKRARLLQHLIFEDLFEADHISNVITDANVNNYNYGGITNDKPVEVSLTDKALLELSQKLLIVPGKTVVPTYNIGKKMHQIAEDLIVNHGVLIDKSFYIGTPPIESGKRDAEFSSVINMINAYKTQTSTNLKSGVKQTRPYTPAYFTTSTIQKSFIDVFDKTTTGWIIALNKTVPYTDHLDRDKEKAIPIVKSFTISTMCEYFMTNRFKSLLPFFKEKQSKTPINPKQPGKALINQKQQSKKPTETAPTIYYDKSGHNYVNEFKYILDSLNTPDNDLNHYIKLIDIYQKNIIISQVRLKHGQQVCNNRLMEGKYINSSLDKMREAIKYILSKKHENSDALFHSPDFIDICLQSYCPTGINCFNTATSANAPESLIDEIYKHLYPVPNDDSKNKFYTDIVISVLCVFNVSRLADNPPTVPYIDINNLKQIYYNKDSAYSQQYPLLWALHKLKLQIDDLKLKHSPLFYRGLMTLIDAAIADYKDKPDNVLTITRENSGRFMVDLTKLIQTIDIHNAASTIGTLEFLDQLAKFNSVNNLCYKNTEDGTTPYLDDSEYDDYVTNAVPIINDA
jgi:hypothetical protein